METLSTINQWTDCLSDNNGKRPRLDPKIGKGLPLAKAMELASYSKYSYGFIFSKDDPYIGIDIDVDPTGKKANATATIPEEVLMFMMAHPTHAHYSPSGHGLHLIYKVTPETAAKLNEQAKKQGACSQAKGAMFDGDWRWDNSFLTFTQNLHHLNAPISVISADDLDTLVGFNQLPINTTAQPQQSNLIDFHTGLTMQAHVPTFEDLQEVLLNVPSTFNHLARKACKTLNHSQPSSNYEYWLLVGQACAHTAIVLEMMQQATVEQVEAEFVIWSSKDPEFVSIDDAQHKFNSLVSSTRTKTASATLQPQTATFKVLTALAKGSMLNFPFLVGKNLLPDMANIKNFEYLVKHEQLTLWFDSMAGGYTVKGPKATIDQWFKTGPLDLQSLATMFLPYLQHKFKQSTSPLQAKTYVQHFKQQAQHTNAFKDWIDSKPWDNVPRFESVCNSITTMDDNPLYKSYIHKSLLSMIGIHYWPEDRPKIPAMLVLSGPQHTYKSSWAEWLIPHELIQYLGMANVDTLLSASIERDRLLSTRAVLVVNECEPLFVPRHEQKIKSAVDQEIVTYRDLYSPTPLSRQRTALLIGTTNKSDLYTGSLGTRKIWQIPVKLCDSRLIKDMDKQQLYAEIKAYLVKFKQDNPKTFIQMAWQQSAEEREEVEEHNRIIKGVTGIDELLVEVFGDPVDTKFDPADYIGPRGVVVRKGNPYNLENRPNGWTSTQLLRFMKDRFPDDNIDRKSLMYAVKRYCGLFTGSKNCTIDPFRSKSSADRSITQGLLTVSKSEKYYLFPEIGVPCEEDDCE